MPSVEQAQCPIEGEMSPEDLKQYFNEVGTSAEALARDAATLRSWINAEPHLPNVTGDLDKWLETVLLASKNSMEKAKTRIDNYFTNHGELNGDMFTLPPPPGDIAVADTSEFMLAGPIPRVIPGGYIVVLEKHIMPPDGNYGRFDMNLQFRRSILFADALLGECKKIKGLILCIDQSNMNMAVGSTFLSCLSGFRRGTNIVQDALPLRIHAVHLINATAPTLQKMLLNAVTPLLKGKLAQRIHIHDGYKTLHEHIPPAYLPAEYGGTDTYTMESIASSVTNYILSKSEWFSSRKWMKTDENRRLVKKPTSSDLGVEGSFRKLCVD